MAHPDEHQWSAIPFYAGQLRRFEPRPTVEARGTGEAEALVELAAALRSDVAYRLEP